MSAFFKGWLFLSLSLPFFVSAKESFLQRCYKSFSGGPDDKGALPLERAKWTNLYAKKLFASVYKQLPLLESQGWTSKEIRPFLSSMEKLLQYLENSLDSEAESRLKLMDSHWSSAVQAVPAIFSFVNSGKAGKYESLDVKGALKLILSTFSRHTMAYLKHPHLNKLDWGRMNVILKSISDFKAKPNVFSLYKIQAAVREKYSLKEYIGCY